MQPLRGKQHQTTQASLLDCTPQHSSKETPKEAQICSSKVWGLQSCYMPCFIFSGAWIPAFCTQCSQGCPYLHSFASSSSLVSGPEEKPFVRALSSCSRKLPWMHSRNLFCLCLSSFTSQQIPCCFKVQDLEYEACFSGTKKTSSVTSSYF